MSLNTEMYFKVDSIYCFFSTLTIWQSHGFRREWPIPRNRFKTPKDTRRLWLSNAFFTVPRKVRLQSSTILTLTLTSNHLAPQGKLERTNWRQLPRTDSSPAEKGPFFPFKCLFGSTRDILVNEQISFLNSAGFLCSKNTLKCSFLSKRHLISHCHKLLQWPGHLQWKCNYENYMRPEAQFWLTILVIFLKPTLAKFDFAGKPI